MKIIGNTMGMGLPKPNLMQTDPSKGDYVKGKEEFLNDPKLVGPKGDPFTYEDFTPEQLAALKGEPGKTPVKGEDYFTDSDKQEIAEQAAEMVDVTSSGADWNQNDETAVDFIKNRPFYEETDVTSIVLFDGDVELFVLMPEGTPEGQWGELLTFENGKIYTVVIEDEQQDIICENNELIFISSTLSDTYALSAYGIFSRYGSDPEGTYHIKIETTEISRILEQLDEKYIPDTIARISDIPEQVQSDWNQNDETAVDFIKNRTHYEKEEMTTRTCSFEYENIDSYEKIAYGSLYYYKISNETYSRTTDIVCLENYNNIETNYTVPTCSDTASVRQRNMTVGRCYIVYTDGYKISATISLSTGIWVMIKNTHLSKVSYIHVTESYSETTIKPLDEKFIPDTIARKEYVNEAKEYVLLNDCENGYEYIVRMINGVITPVCRCSEISIDTMPNKTEYFEGESLDLTGLVVIATRQDGSTFVVTNYDTPTELPSDGIVSISYIEAGITYTTNFSITISPVDSGEEDELPV